MPNTPNTQRSYSPAMERLARDRGFPSATAMADWARQRSRPRTQQTTTGQGALPESVREVTRQASAWHPRRMFNYLAESLRGARE